MKKKSVSLISKDYLIFLNGSMLLRYYLISNMYGNLVAYIEINFRRGLPNPLIHTTVYGIVN